MGVRDGAVECAAAGGCCGQDEEWYNTCTTHSKLRENTKIMEQSEDEEENAGRHYSICPKIETREPEKRVAR